MTRRRNEREKGGQEEKENEMTKWRKTEGK
jgi:hypothetical protein